VPTKHLIIYGQVQGVFYRATAKEVADQIGIAGWVKNTEDGSVEIMASGTEEELNKFIEWCKQGPRKAVVDKVKVLNTGDHAFNGFKIIRGE
jgi:acylphosphatase